MRSASVTIPMGRWPASTIGMPLTPCRSIRSTSSWNVVSLVAVTTVVVMMSRTRTAASLLDRFPGPAHPVDDASTGDPLDVDRQPPAPLAWQPRLDAMPAQVLVARAESIGDVLAEALHQDAPPTLVPPFDAVDLERHPVQRDAVELGAG